MVVGQLRGRIGYMFCSVEGESPGARGKRSPGIEANISRDGGVTGIGHGRCTQNCEGLCRTQAYGPGQSLERDAKKPRHKYQKGDSDHTSGEWKPHVTSPLFVVPQRLGNSRS